jgi:PTH1 family peptidyl-tRNA hydrolase
MTSFLVAGLGNNEKVYEGTRHNIGVELLIAFAKKEQAPEWKIDKKLKFTTIKIGKNTATLLIPLTLMNQSGLAFNHLFNSENKPYKPEQLILIHDDMDLPLGSFKISFNRGFGGHRGVESVAKTIKSSAFARIRIGVSPITSKGVVKKPKGEEAVVTFILGKFKPKETEIINKLSEQVSKGLSMMISDAKFGREKAMGEFN